MEQLWAKTLSRADMVAFVREAGARYWPNKIFPTDTNNGDIDLTKLGREWVEVDALFIDKAAVTDAGVDWYLAAFSYLSGIAEWHHEVAHGPAHSFAFRVKKIPSRCFDHAWANRIMLHMRKIEGDEKFGPLPKAEIIITHDVDALDKTWPIRLKQTAFETFNCLRFLLAGKFAHACGALARGLRMLFTTPRYYHLDTIADMVKAAGLRSIFHLHVRHPKRSAKHWLMDPGYRIDDARLKDFVAHRAKEGFQFGLHPAYDVWKDAVLLRNAREGMERALGISPKHIRQHWLRFSFRDTWRAQAEAGLSEDSTLGFNDRTGFRTASALRYQPWDFVNGHAHTIHATPMIAMDSQFYSYQDMSAGERKRAMEALLSEVHAVHGVATVLWHPHTLSPDYGWQQGFADLLASIKS